MQLPLLFEEPEFISSESFISLDISLQSQVTSEQLKGCFGVPHALAVDQPKLSKATTSISIMSALSSKPEASWTLSFNYHAPELIIMDLQWGSFKPPPRTYHIQTQYFSAASSLVEKSRIWLHRPDFWKWNKRSSGKEKKPFVHKENSLVSIGT